MAGHEQVYYRTRRIKSTLILFPCFPSLLFRSLKFSSPSRSTTVAFSMPDAIPADWFRGQRIPVGGALFRDSSDGNYTAVKFLVWLNQRATLYGHSPLMNFHYTIVVRWFCPFRTKPREPCNYRPRVQIASKDPWKCVSRTLVSASSDKHTLCQARICTHGPIRKLYELPRDLRDN